MMDIALGVRYQIWHEATATKRWQPTLTFRAGAVLPGSYEKDFPFAPGDRSAAIEPELLARKHFAATGLGAYADALFRWNRTTHNDHWIVSAGLFQQIKSWELNVGYRHLGSVDGEDIAFDPDSPVAIDYPRAPREGTTPWKPVSATPRSGNASSGVSIRAPSWMVPTRMAAIRN